MFSFPKYIADITTTFPVHAGQIDLVSQAYVKLEMRWTDKINEEIKTNAPSEANDIDQWKEHSIYKVPSQVTKLNKKAYKETIFIDLQ